MRSTPPRTKLLGWPAELLHRLRSMAPLSLECSHPCLVDVFLHPPHPPPTKNIPYPSLCHQPRLPIPRPSRLAELRQGRDLAPGPGQELREPLAAERHQRRHLPRRSRSVENMADKRMENHGNKSLESEAICKRATGAVSDRTSTPPPPSTLPPAASTYLRPRSSSSLRAVSGESAAAPGAFFTGANSSSRSTCTGEREHELHGSEEQ